MIYYVCALYWEAQPFIQALNLKKQQGTGRFQTFVGENAVCLVTGTGAMSAAVALSGLLACRQPSPADLIINTGVCGSTTNGPAVGEICLCHAILDQAAGRAYYPDLLFAHPFAESAVMTVPRLETPLGDFHSPPRDLSSLRDAFPLRDMEASGVFAAALAYLQPHQILIVKTVSDKPESPMPTPKQVLELMEDCASRLSPWAAKAEALLEEPPAVLSEEDHRALWEASERLKLSVSMTASLEQAARYCRLHGQIPEELIHGFFTEYDIHCTSKREGKDYFELLRGRLLSAVFSSHLCGAGIVGGSPRGGDPDPVSTGADRTHRPL